MKIETFEYPIEHGLCRTSRCRMTSWHHDGKVIAVATELPDNPGPSITNSAEDLWRAWCRVNGHKLDDVVKMEHYAKSPGFVATLDGVTITEKTGQFTAGWFPVTEAVFHKLTGKTTRQAGLN